MRMHITDKRRHGRINKVLLYSYVCMYSYSIRTKNLHEGLFIIYADRGYIKFRMQHLRKSIFDFFNSICKS